MDREPRPDERIQPPREDKSQTDDCPFCSYPVQKSAECPVCSLEDPE